MLSYFLSPGKNFYGIRDIFWRKSDIYSTLRTLQMAFETGHTVFLVGNICFAVRGILSKNIHIANIHADTTTGTFRTVNAQYHGLSFLSFIIMPLEWQFSFWLEG
jgi:hypothetical protein